MEVIKYFYILFLVLFLKVGYSQTSIDTLTNRVKILEYYSIRELNSIWSEEDSCTYLYSQISYTTTQIGQTFEINGEIFASNKHKEEIWVAKIDRKGDTIYTRVISEIPDFRSIYSIAIKKGIFYFIVSNTYIKNNNESQGCLFISYDPKSKRTISEQIYEMPYKVGDCLFTKDNNSFYLIVEDKPHHCLPPEWNVYAVQLSNKGKVIQKKRFDKTICKGGSYDPKLIHQNKTSFYMSDAEFFKKDQKIPNICNLNLYDVFEKKSISYSGYKQYISKFSIQTLKKTRKTILPCGLKVIAFLNDSDYVCSKIDNLTKNKINFVFRKFGKTNNMELEVETYNWHDIKILNDNLFVFGTKDNNFNIKRIKEGKVVFDKTYFLKNNRQNSFVYVIPIILQDKVRYYYKINNPNYTGEIRYFDEKN